VSAGEGKNRRTRREDNKKFDGRGRAGTWRCAPIDIATWTPARRPVFDRRMVTDLKTAWNGAVFMWTGGDCAFFPSWTRRGPSEKDSRVEGGGGR